MTGTHLSQKHETKHLLRLPVSLDKLQLQIRKKSPADFFYNILSRIIEFSLAFSRTIKYKWVSDLPLVPTITSVFTFINPSLYLLQFQQELTKNKQKEYTGIHIQTIKLLFQFKLSTHPLYPNVNYKHHWWLFHCLLKCARKQEKQ